MRIEFLKETNLYLNNRDEFVAYLPKVKSEDDLFNKLSEILYLPNYFGHNWNALFDCLRDFHWIKQIGIVLVHNEIPQLPDEVLKTYVQILFDASQDWKDGDEHYFKVIFPGVTEKLVNDILFEEGGIH